VFVCFQIVIIWLVSLVYSLPRYFEYEIRNGSTEVTDLVRKNKLYTVLYRIVCHFILMYFIPMVLIIVLNLRLLYALKKSHRVRKRLSKRNSGQSARHKEQQSVTIVVVSVAVVFFSCNLLAMTSQIIWSLQECFHDVMSHLENYRRYMAHVSNVMVTLNSATNFLIYCSVSKTFRKNFTQLFCQCRPINRYLNLGTYFLPTLT
jgi:predicted PurR-regulated permease PerM